jgi:hypothetical protein
MTLLDEGRQALLQADMYLYAATAQWRLGQVQGGDKGRAHVESAKQWMLAQALRDPERFGAMLLPGFGAGS